LFSKKIEWCNITPYTHHMPSLKALEAEAQLVIGGYVLAGIDKRT
jgi:hypothetical protein